MRKFLLITILALFLCMVGVSAQPSFEIIEDSVSLTGTHDQTLSGSFTVNNTGTEDLAIDFTYSTLTDGGDPLTISNLEDITNLGNGTSRTVTFSVVIPNKQTPGSYTGTLTATSNLTDTDTIEINVEVTSTYSVSVTPTQINLGSASLNSTYAREFTITNTGNGDITDVSFEFSDADFNLNANKTDFTLPFDGMETIRFNITIPADYSTGNLTLGTVNLVSTERNKELFSIKANIGGGLEIEDVDVYLTTREPKSGSDLDVNDGEELNFGDEDVGPESELRFNLNIENTFSDDEDVDINDITVKVTILEIDDGEDIEEESEEFDLDSDSNEDVNVYVNIPLSVNAGNYDVLIEALGEDDSGNEHTAQMNLKLDIDKEQNEVIVSEASLFPEKIKCSGSSTLTATIKNIGTKPQEKAQLEIINSDLGVNFVLKDIELQEDPFDGDDEYTKKLVVNVDRNTKAGTYPIQVRAYLQEGILWETKKVNLVVEACARVGEEEEEIPEEEPEEEEIIEETEPVEVIEEPEEEVTEGEEIEILAPVTTTEIPLTKRPIFWVLVVLLNIIVIAVVALLVVKLIEKK